MKKLYVCYIIFTYRYIIIKIFLLLTFLSTLTTCLLDVRKNLMTHTTIFPHFSFTVTRIILSIANFFKRRIYHTADIGIRPWNILLDHKFSHRKIVKQFSSRLCREFRLKARFVIFFCAFPSFSFSYHTLQTTSFYTSYTCTRHRPTIALCHTSVLRGLFTTPHERKKTYILTSCYCL